MIPEDLYYTKEHEWAKLDGNEALVGISEFAQEQLGEVTFVELPGIGLDVKANEPLGSVESVKAASDIYSPVTGKVVEINDALNNQPELLNDDCYGDGWFCKIKVSGPDALDGLMNAAAYEAYLKDAD